MAPCIPHRALAADPAAQVQVAPYDAPIRYSGRWDTADKTGPRCEWPACMVTLKFTGTAINARLSDPGHNFWQVFVDGKPAAKLALQSGAHDYPIVSGLAPGEHIVTLAKATESFFGPTQFLGFTLDAGAKPLAPAPVTRRIEVIGDSISCGYGLEAANQREHFSPGTENAADAYGALAARKLDADYACLAWSGRKMWPDNTLPEIYDRTIPTEPASKWDFSSWTPDAIIINLSTNDFGKADPDEAQWTAAYRRFIALLRTHYPNAQIYCCTGPMLGDGATRKPRADAVRYVQEIVATENTAGDAKIHFLDFGQQDSANGIG
ncbi:MAG TPA: SGNH/GDSL hydrolase family protein, partial [Chthoniobacteraceae bacterium]|nr:SGNH/GDSL hydrolase family protein [Chthoniobacteraceae bacterium]